MALKKCTVLVVLLAMSIWLCGCSSEKPHAYSAKEPIPFSLQVQDYRPPHKLQLLVRCDLVDGWLPDLKDLKQIADDACERFGISVPDDVERVFVNYVLPKMRTGYFAQYHNEKGSVSLKYSWVDLDDSLYSALRLPEKACAPPPPDPKTDDPYRLYAAAQQAEEAGCMDAAVQFYTRAIKSGRLTIKAEKNGIYDYAARALGNRGETLCRLAVLRRDRRLYAQAISDLAQALKQLNPKDSAADGLRWMWERLLKGARYASSLGTK